MEKRKYHIIKWSKVLISEPLAIFIRIKHTNKTMREQNQTPCLKRKDTPLVSIGYFEKHGRSSFLVFL